MLEATETTLYKQNASLVRPSMRPRDLKLNKEQRHDKLGHFGSHRNCIHCQQVKQRPRRVYKNPTPVYDHIPGRSIHMDSMYVDVKHCTCYQVVGGWTARRAGFSLRLQKDKIRTFIFLLQPRAVAPSIGQFWQYHTCPDSRSLVSAATAPIHTTPSSYSTYYSLAATYLHSRLVLYDVAAVPC